MNKMPWLTTAPNPKSSATGYDAGQRGWKLHYIDSDANSFKLIRWKRAMCGLQPAHGWGLDAFIEDKCERCRRALREVLNEDH
jgi:hypothetical protein